MYALKIEAYEILTTKVYRPQNCMYIEVKIRYELCHNIIILIKISRMIYFFILSIFFYYVHYIIVIREVNGIITIYINIFHQKNENLVKFDLDFVGIMDSVDFV